MKTPQKIISELSAEFPKNSISWRAQSVTKTSPYKAMALAYIDARDVMNRLDEVVGAGCWQDRYPHAGIKTICEIGIKIDNEWIWKSDGAGDTDVEAEKGAISDAFKRAAVKWGIGRYLYDMPAPWVPCEAKEYNGKITFSKFIGDPWSYVKLPLKVDKISPTDGEKTAQEAYGTSVIFKAKMKEIIDSFDNAETVSNLLEINENNKSHIDTIKQIDSNCYEEIKTAYKRNYKVLYAIEQQKKDIEERK